MHQVFSRAGLTYGFVALIISAAATTTVKSAQSQSVSANPTLILATTEGAGTRSRSIDGILAKDDPGHYVELARKAANSCGASVEFKFMNWARVLKAVRAGQVSAGFASSYKKERAEYGAYPMKDGKPNEALAQRSYVYHLYARKDDAAAINDWTSQIAGSVVSVEKSSSIIPALEKLDAKFYERTDYDNQLELLVNKRFRFVAGIADNFDAYVSASPKFEANIVRLDPPIEKRVGYVMFGKKFYKKHTELVDCYWLEAAKLGKSEWYKNRKSYYEKKYE